MHQKHWRHDITEILFLKVHHELPCHFLCNSMFNTPKGSPPSGTDNDSRFLLMCNLFIFKEKQRYKYKNIWHACTILHRQRHLIYLHKTFCSTAVKFQTPRTVSNGNHYIYILWLQETLNFKTISSVSVVSFISSSMG
jgi:hypothetical protein